MPPFLERLGIKPPTASEIQDPAFSRDLIFKKLDDLFCPNLKSNVSEMPDDPVQDPTLKSLKFILDGIFNLIRNGF
jgi:hypothetical protein